MAEHQRLMEQGFRKFLSAWPNSETGRLDVQPVHQLMSDLEAELGQANVAAVDAVFDGEGYIKTQDEVMTIYIRDQEPRLF